MSGDSRKSGPKNDDRIIAKEAILKLARALARQAAREDHERENREWRKRRRKRILKPTTK